MTAHPNAPARIDGLDLARYLALVGMVIVNFSIVMGADNDTGWAHAFAQSLSGRAAATFVVLAGIGLGDPLCRPHRFGHGHVGSLEPD